MRRQVKSEPEPNLDPDARCYKCDALLGMGVTRCWVCDKLNSDQTEALRYTTFDRVLMIVVCIISAAVSLAVVYVLTQ